MLAGLPPPCRDFPDRHGCGMRIGINGFGRIGRLVLRALWGRSGIEPVHINDPRGDADAMAHLLQFDSVHGRWHHGVRADGDRVVIEEQCLTTSRERDFTRVNWAALGVKLVLEASGRFRDPQQLQAYIHHCGVQRLIVACPLGGDALDVVYGINDHLYDPSRHHLLTAASCTTNSLAPLVQVVHEGLGIVHGSITTIHNITNTQVPIDSYTSDLRRARSLIQSLIPTTTGSARAIARIFPELEGRLDGHAVRVPLLNASLTDAVFELQRDTTVAEVNGLFAAAAAGPLKGILGYETRPLVSVDYVNDSRSAIVDGLSTLVVDGCQLKVYAWYDNEWGYACRMADLACKVVALDG